MYGLVSPSPNVEEFGSKVDPSIFLVALKPFVFNSDPKKKVLSLSHSMSTLGPVTGAQQWESFHLDGGLLFFVVMYVVR